MIALVGLLSLLASAAAQSCNIRTTKYGSVCVCNARYCDTVPELDVSVGKYQVFSTSEQKLGFSSKIGLFSNKGLRDVTINVNKSERHQSIIGFGGAFTDSVGINLKSLPEETQEKLIQSYFGEDGIGYSLCRVPIGGTDFSVRAYSYDDVENDDTLEHFELQEEDLKYKIPFIQRANELRHNELKLFASAWTAPKWMKTNNEWAGIGFLKEEYYQLWADYAVKFFEEYRKHDINFWGMTTQNEPADGLMSVSMSRLNAMGWLPSQMNKWIGENLGPTIRNNSVYKDLKIMLHDETRLTLPLLIPLLLNNVTMSYADGVAMHWYTNFFIPTFTLNLLKVNKKDWFFISSEACNGYLNVAGKRLEQPVEKGSWKRGVKYVTDILDNLEYGAGGWVDWNMALDETGGPNYIDNVVDSPILVNETLQEFYKQPMFYALGHFSKFVIPLSVRVGATVLEEETDIRAMAFLRPDNLTALIIQNMGNTTTTILIEDITSGSTSIVIEANSINTVLYS